VQIGFGGSLPREVCSRSSPPLVPFLALKVVASLGRVCGRLRLIRRRLFFFFFFFSSVVGGLRQDPYS
jgi:hypothetical protein